MTNPQKPKTPPYSKDVVGRDSSITSIPDLTVQQGLLREQLENIIGTGLGWVKYDKPEDYELSIYGGMWVEYDGKSGHDLSKAKFLDDIMQLIATERLDELIWATGGIREFTDDGKDVIHKRIDDLQRLQQGKNIEGEK